MKRLLTILLCLFMTSLCSAIEWTSVYHKPNMEDLSFYRYVSAVTGEKCYMIEVSILGEKHVKRVTQFTILNRHVRGLVKINVGKNEARVRFSTSEISSYVVYREHGMWMFELWGVRGIRENGKRIIKLVKTGVTAAISDKAMLNLLKEFSTQKKWTNNNTRHPSVNRSRLWK